MKRTSDSLTRESFTMPKSESVIFENLEDRFPRIRPAIKKSEVIRVGLHEVTKLSEREVRRILEEDLGRLQVGRQKTGSLAKPEEVSQQNEVVISDKQWREVKRLLVSSSSKPGADSQRGRRREIDDRAIINGILFIFRFGRQRRNCPQGFGSFAT